MADPHIIETLLPKAVEFRARMINEHCKTHDEAIALATVLMMQVELIFKELGGSKMVAAQFYAMADRAALASH